MSVQDIISVIIPSRNVDYLLENSIEKMRQLYPTVKIYLILDVILPEDYKKFDENIILLKSDKYTMSAKRNQGVKLADKKYIALIDSDAYPDKNWLEIGIDFLEKNPKYSAATGCQMNYPNDSFEQKCLRLLRFSPLFSQKEWLKIIELNTVDTDCEEFMTSNVIIKRDTYLALNGMNEDFYLAEDNEFSNRMFQNGYKIRFIANMKVFHREAETYPFLRKFYAISTYYAKCFVRKIRLKNNSQTFAQFLPFIGSIFYLALLFVQIFIFQSKFALNMLIILPIFIFLALLWNSYVMAKKLGKDWLKGTIFLIFVSILFCFVWVVGTATGLVKIPLYDERNGYKHY